MGQADHVHTKNKSNSGNMPGNHWKKLQIGPGWARERQFDALLFAGSKMTIASKKSSSSEEGYPQFDWLRLFLASAVVLGHAGLELPQPFTASMAVEVFFALSGWLIGGILIRSNSSDLPRFFFNRSTRIWIPYLFAILLLYGLAAVKEGTDFFWFKYLFLDLTFTHQLFTFFPAATNELPLDGSGNQFWSISVEEQFYLVAPLLMFFAPWGRSWKLWTAIALATWVLDWNAASIALGVSAAILQAERALFDSGKVRLLALVLAIVSSLGLYMTDNESVFGPAVAVTVVTALASKGPRGWLGGYAGGLSYPLYLNHWIGAFAVHFVSKRYFPVSDELFIVLQYVINIGLALMFYILIDQQIQRHRGDWYSPKVGKTLTVLAYSLVSAGLVGGTVMHFYGPHG